MSRIEFNYLLKFASTGVLNTLVGFAVIFVAMSLGVSPVVSNIAGYATGFTLGFLLSKKFVFRGQGRFLKESLRYLLAFILAFFLNVITLQCYMYWYPLQALQGQVIAAVVYTGIMYLLVRFYVFHQ